MLSRVVKRCPEPPEVGCEAGRTRCVTRSVLALDRQAQVGTVSRLGRCGDTTSSGFGRLRVLRRSHRADRADRADLAAVRPIADGPDALRYASVRRPAESFGCGARATRSGAGPCRPAQPKPIADGATRRPSTSGARSWPDSELPRGRSCGLGPGSVAQCCRRRLLRSVVGSSQPQVEMFSRRCPAP